MKLCHVAIVTPHMAGLYETTRELVAAERALGYDARVFDPAPTPFYPKEPEDRGALLCDKSFLDEADVIIDHSGCDGTTDGMEKPHILVAHGRPRHSFNSGNNGGPPIYAYHHRLNRTAKYKAVLTFWSEHVDYLKVMFPDKPVYATGAPCDLKAWTPDGPKGYAFHGKAGAYNVVCTDAWRDDVDPWEAIMAVALAARQFPGIKLHIYGKQGDDKGWQPLFKQLQEEGTLGEVCGWVSGLDHVYRAASLMVTPHHIFTRSRREAMACGCHSLSVKDGSRQSVDTICDALREPLDRCHIRRLAEHLFNPLDIAKAFLAAVEKVL